jgi:hypothetical protein
MYATCPTWSIELERNAEKLKGLRENAEMLKAEMLKGGK